MHWQPKLPMQIILVVVCSFCLSTITLFSFMRWLCKSPFVFGKSYGVVRRNKLLIDCDNFTLGNSFLCQFYVVERPLELYKSTT